MCNQFKSSTCEPMATQFTEDVTAMLVTPSSAENQMTLSRGRTSQMQGQNLSRGYDLFSQALNKGNPAMHPLGMSNEYTATSSQTIKERPALPPALQSDATVNSNRAWNPMWLQQNQSAAEANGSQYYQNYLQYAPAYNPNNQSNVPVHHAYGDQVMGPAQFSRLEQPMASQMRQVAPANANKSTTPLQQATVPEFPTARAHIPNPFTNQNGKRLRSADQHQAMLSLQNQTQNLLTGRQTNSSSPNQGPNAGPALQGPSNAPENPRLLDLMNSSGNNREFIGFGFTILIVLSSLISYNISCDFNSHVFVSFSNSLYDPAYETLGLPVDPHLRMFQAMTARGEKGYRMYD
ncbi:hypothetical protein VNO80_06459 [Phaseolus coccineus]|uniref:Uncharacterized protein n=1 Tax=Phaseolus coccineus TaxID=3886 RepID=A0AAN9NLT3_PHACN